MALRARVHRIGSAWNTLSAGHARPVEMDNLSSSLASAAWTFRS